MDGCTGKTSDRNGSDYAHIDNDTPEEDPAGISLSLMYLVKPFHGVVCQSDLWSVVVH